MGSGLNFQSFAIYIIYFPENIECENLTALSFDLPNQFLEFDRAQQGVIFLSQK